MSAFNYLDGLDKRFSSESGSVLFNDVSNMRSLHFRVGQYDLLLPLNTSTEIISDIEYSPVPISRPWLLGIASRRGQLLTLIDLKNFLFNAEPIKKISNKRIVTNNVGNICLGLVVDQVIGLMNPNKNAIESAYPDHWDNALVNILSGVYHENETFFGVCDFEKLVTDERFAESNKIYN